MEGKLNEKPAQTTPPREPARGNPVVRAIGWTLGAAVVLGTVALVAVAVTGPAPQQTITALKPARKCPPDVSVPMRPVGFPVDDVVGVRPGMNARDIEETVKCASEDYVLETRALKRGAAAAEKTRPLIVATLGQERLSFALFGAPGMEQTAGAWREVLFDAGAGPPVADIEAMLAAQYGAPHESRATPDGARVLTWVYAPNGYAIRTRPAEGDIIGMTTYMAKGWDVAACLKNLPTDPEAALVWDGRCGLTIRAEIDPGLGDRARASRWRLSLIDQVTLARQAAPLRAMGAGAAPPP